MDQAFGWAIDAISNWPNDSCCHVPKHDAEWAHSPKAATARKGLFVYEGERRIIVLHAYDKTKDRTRLSQQREIAEARRILEIWSAARG